MTHPKMVNNGNEKMSELNSESIELRNRNVVLHYEVGLWSNYTNVDRLAEFI